MFQLYCYNNHSTTYELVAAGKHVIVMEQCMIVTPMLHTNLWVAIFKLLYKQPYICSDNNLFLTVDILIHTRVAYAFMLKKSDCRCYH